MLRDGQLWIGLEVAAVCPSIGLRSGDDKDRIELSRNPTHLNMKSSERYIYVSKTPKVFARIRIDNGLIASIDETYYSDEATFSNTFAVKATSQEAELLSLKPGDPFQVDYEWDERDVHSTDGLGFSNVDEVVNGGAILVQNGTVLSNYSPINSPDYYVQRTAVCIKADGSWTMYVGAGLLHDLATKLQADGCVDAINMDGSGSTMMHFRGEPASRSRFVSDVIAVMPREKKKLASFLTKGSGIFLLLDKKDEKGIETLLHTSPGSLVDRNANRQVPLQALLKSEGPDQMDAVQKKIADFLESHMNREDLLLKDAYGDTSVHTAFRTGHFELAHRMVKKLHFEDFESPGLGGIALDELAKLDPANPILAIMIKHALQTPITEKTASVLLDAIESGKEHKAILSHLEQRFKARSENEIEKVLKLLAKLLNRTDLRDHFTFQRGEKIFLASLKSGLAVNTSAALVVLGNLNSLRAFPHYDEIVSEVLEIFQDVHNEIDRYTRIRAKDALIRFMEVFGVEVQGLDTFLLEALKDPTTPTAYIDTDILQPMMNQKRYAFAKDFISLRAYNRVTDADDILEMKRRHLQLVHLLWMSEGISEFFIDDLKLARASKGIWPRESLHVLVDFFQEHPTEARLEEITDTVRRLYDRDRLTVDLLSRFTSVLISKVGQGYDSRLHSFAAFLRDPSTYRYFEPAEYGYKLMDALFKTDEGFAAIVARFEQDLKFSEGVLGPNHVAILELGLAHGKDDFVLKYLAQHIASNGDSYKIQTLLWELHEHDGLLKTLLETLLPRLQECMTYEGIKTLREMITLDPSLAKPLFTNVNKLILSGVEFYTGSPLLYENEEGKQALSELIPELIRLKNWMALVAFAGALRYDFWKPSILKFFEDALASEQDFQDPAKLEEILRVTGRLMSTFETTHAAERVPALKFYAHLLKNKKLDQEVLMREGIFAAGNWTFLAWHRSGPENRKDLYDEMTAIIWSLGDKDYRRFTQRFYKTMFALEPDRFDQVLLDLHQRISSALSGAKGANSHSTLSFGDLEGLMSSLDWMVETIHFDIMGAANSKDQYKKYVPAILKELEAYKSQLGNKTEWYLKSLERRLNE